MNKIDLSKFFEVLKSELIAHADDIIDNLNTFKTNIAECKGIGTLQRETKRIKKSLSTFDQRVSSSYERADYIATSGNKDSKDD